MESQTNEAEENRKQAELMFMLDSTTQIFKSSIDLKLLKQKICFHENHKEIAPEEFSSVFSELTEWFQFLFVVDKFVVPRNLKKPLGDALHFNRRGSSKILERAFFWCSGKPKNIENKCNTCTTCMSSGKNLYYQLPSTENINQLVLTETEKNPN